MRQNLGPHDGVVCNRTFVMPTRIITDPQQCQLPARDMVFNFAYKDNEVRFFCVNAYLSCWIRSRAYYISRAILTAEWITYAENKVLWLPPDYRIPSCVYENRIALETVRGHVSVIRIDPTAFEFVLN
jgi:hypothetical protein